MHSQIIVRAFGIEGGQCDVVEATCALCGQVAARSVHVSRLITSTTADLGMFNGAERVCNDCAALFAAYRFTGNFVAVDGQGIRPVVAVASSTADRPTWRDVLRWMRPHAETVACITSNTKRRLWPRTVVSSYGPRWRPLFVDEGHDCLLAVDRIALLDCLALVEEVYTAGFSKAQIGTSLYRANGDYGVVAPYERALQQWRAKDEFLVSLFVAQKD